MAEANWQNLVAMFYDQADRFGERPFLWSKHDGHYRPLTWREVAASISALARGLTIAGVRRGNRVVLAAENRPEWLIADLAIMATGAITVPAYTTNTEDDHYHILSDSGAICAIASTQKIAGNLLPAVRRSSNTKLLIIIEPSNREQTSDITTLAWDDVIHQGEHAHTNIVETAAHISHSDVACLIYTSGTSGSPKGVILDHGAILHNCMGAKDAIEELGLNDAIFLSFLPLSHAYEHTAGQFLPIYIGAQIYYAEGVDKLAANLVEVRPTLMTAVPRLYEALQQRILHGVRKAGGSKERLFMEALEIGGRRHQDPDSLGLVDKLRDLFLERMVRSKVRERFGGRLKAMISGGAPLVPEVGAFFTALGLPVYQGYGQTEAAPLISVNLPSKTKMDTVGPPIKGVEVRIADDGEILVRGRMVMQGYWRNEEATAEVIRDGWLHTGDIGEIDADGYIRITDRKKDIIVNSGGDNLSPSRVEGILSMQPEIAQAMVYGDRRPHLVALLVPDEQWMTTWGRSAGKNGTLAGLAEDADFHNALGQVIDRVNRGLSVVEKVRKFTIADEPFTIENSQLTPTMKIRRHILNQIYGAKLEDLYG